MATEKGTKVVRIPTSMHKRIDKLRDRVSRDIQRQGLDPPSHASVLRACLDLGIHKYGQRIAAEEKRATKRAASSG